MSSVHCLALACVLLVAFACDMPNFDFNLYSEPSPPSSASLIACYSSLSFTTALQSALTFPTSTILFLIPGALFQITASVVISTRLELIGNGGTLTLASQILISRTGEFLLTDVRIEELVNFTTAGIDSEGKLSLKAVNTTSFDTYLVEISGGELEMIECNFARHRKTLVFQKEAGGKISILSSRFVDMNNGLIGVYIGNSSEFEQLQISNCKVIGGAGTILHFLQNPISHYRFIVQSSLFEGYSGSFLSGKMNQITAIVSNTTFNRIQQIISGPAETSTLIFDNCTILCVSDPPFKLDSLKGLLTLSNSIVSNVRQGPVFLISNNAFPLTDAILNVTNCRISSVTNMNYQFSGAVLFVTSVTAMISDTEVWGITVLKSGLMSVTMGVALLTNVLYRDSSVSITSFMDGMISTIVLKNVTMARVENNDGAVMATLATTFGSWDNVTVIDSIDRHVTQYKDYIVLWVGFGAVYSVNNSYIRNEGQTLISMAATSHGFLSISNTVYKNMNAVRIFDMYLGGMIHLTNVTFEDSKAIYMINCAQDEPCSVLSDIHFTGTFGIQAIFSLAPGQTEIRNTHFDSIPLILFYVLIGGKALISNTSFINAPFTFCRDCIDSDIAITDFHSDNTTSETMFQLTFTEITAENCYLRNVRAVQLFSLVSSNVTLTHSEIVDSYVESLGGLFTAEMMSVITIQFSRIEAIFGRNSMSLGLVYVRNSVVTLIDSQFRRVNSTLIYSILSTIAIDSCSFLDGGLQHFDKLSRKMCGGVLRDDSSTYIRITNSEFVGISADLGGVLCLSRRTNDNVAYEFSNNTVENCSAEIAGGAIHSTSACISISTSTFSHNKSQRGGAIWVSSFIPSLSLSISETIFFNNSAMYDGGAIQYINSTIEISNSVLANNSAIYGSNIASGIKKIAVIDMQTRELIPNFTAEAASGQALTSTIFLGLFDEIGQLILTDNISQLSLFSLDPSVSVEGSVILYPDSGVYSASNLILAGEPLSSVSISGTVKSFSGLVFTVHFRSCTIGEHFSNSRCHLCTNNMYSLTPDTPCKLCPATAVCTEGFRISLLPGYWRGSNMTDVIHPCLIRELCLGGFENHCLDGHTGVLCNECEKDHFKGNQLQCLPCKGAEVAAMKSVLTFVVSMSGIIAYLYLNENSRMVHTVVFDYLHIVRIIANLNIYWPSSIGFLLVVMGDIGSVGLTSFTDPCFGTISGMELIYFQIIVSITYFITVCLTVYLSGCIVCLIWHCVSIHNKVLLIVFEVCYLMVPLLFMRSIQLFSCYEINEVNRLIYDPSVECWTPKHKKFAYGVALPILIVSLLFSFALLLRSMRRFKRLLPPMPRWKAVYLTFLQVRCFALSNILVFSNSLALASQSSLTIVITIATEIILNSAQTCRHMYFSSLYQCTLASSIAFVFLCVIYDSQMNKTKSSAEPIFFVVCYIDLFFPLLYTLFSFLYYRTRRNKYLNRANNLPPAPQVHIAINDSTHILIPLSLPLEISSIQAEMTTA